MSALLINCHTSVLGLDDFPALDLHVVEFQEHGEFDVGEVLHLAQVVLVQVAVREKTR